MRISDSTATTLAQLSRKHFGESAVVRLFGSRLNDSTRGGDIDIQVVAPGSSFRDEVAFLADVGLYLDERVDIRVQRGDAELIDQIAMQYGVPLHDRQ